MCKLGFKRVLRQNGLTCADVALRYVSDRCSFVELHHYDVSMLPVFEAAGFDSILFMRDPIDLWVSWSVALSTELAHCWPADMQMPDRRYNYAVAPSFWPSKAQWLKAREQLVRGQKLSVLDHALMLSAQVYSKQYLASRRSPSLALQYLSSCLVDADLNCAREIRAAAGTPRCAESLSTAKCSALEGAMASDHKNITDSGAKCMCGLFLQFFRAVVAWADLARALLTRPQSILCPQRFILTLSLCPQRF